MSLTFWTIFSALFSGSFCAIALNIAAKRDNRLKMALFLIQKKDEMIETIEDSFDILKYDIDKNGLVFLPRHKKPTDEEVASSKKKFDTIITVGDFLNRVALMYLSWQADPKILKRSELYSILLIFLYLLSKNNFQTQYYDHKSPEPRTDFPFRNWKNDWPFLYDFFLCHDNRFLKNRAYRKLQFFEFFF